MLTNDEGVRGATTAESLAGLRPVFDKNGTVTAGNASTLNDGASAVLIAEAEFAKAQGWEVIATIEDYCTSGVEPARVMSAPIPAVQTLLERNNLDVLDVDVYEHNEAFASASCAVAQEVGIPEGRFNLHGGRRQPRPSPGRKRYPLPHHDAGCHATAGSDIGYRDALSWWWQRRRHVCSPARMSLMQA